MFILAAVPALAADEAAVPKKYVDARDLRIINRAFDDTERYLRAHWQPGDLVLTMGCGDVNMLNEQIHRHEMEKKQ